VKQRTHKPCATCGKEFKLFRTTDKYCSPDCVENKPQKKSVVPINKVSEKLSKELVEYRKVRDQYMKSTPVCEVRGCPHPPTDLHHRKGRGKYLCVVEYFMAVCRAHHNYIEMYPIWAKENGYSVDRLN
jgi:hypothetical protein